MFSNSSGLTPTDVLALNNNGGGAWGEGSWLWFLIVVIALFNNGWGNGGLFGGNGGSAAENYILASDFATIQRQLSDGFNGIDNALDRQNTGICDLGYTNLSLNNQTNMNMMQGFNNIQTQLADCCCTTNQNIKDTQYAIATTGANIQNQLKDCCCDIEKQNMQTNYNMATQNCATLQAISDSTRQIIDYMANKDAQALRDENFALKLSASQEHQNNYLVNQLRPTPIPSFNVGVPFGYGYGYGYGCNGTTIV